jgi:type 1 glutamine amidotransferase
MYKKSFQILAIALAVAGMLLPAAGFAQDEAAETAKAKVVLIAGAPSHPPGEHEHRAGCMLLAKELNENMPNVNAEVAWYGWPEDESILDDAAAIVMYCDGGFGHVANRNLDKLQELADKGVGIVAIHYGVEVPKGKVGDRFLDWIGGYFETDWSVNPHWTASFEEFPDHPITNGISPWEIRDEWYYHMRFPEEMKGVTPILTDLPTEETLTRADGPHEGNPAVREAIANGEPQHVAWAFERADGGRGFGFTGAHFHKNWKEDNFRKLVLNAIVWAAKVEVPEAGVPSTTPTEEEMQANQDDKGKKRK